MRLAIAIPVHAEPQRFLATLESIAANTPQEHELLVIPDGADSGVRSALAQVSARVLNDDGARGGAACFNKLFRSTNADVGVLVESGSVVAPRWLEHLLAALDSSPQAGLAGPSTNTAWNEQRVFVGAGGSAEEIAATAREAERRFGAQRRTLAPLYSLNDFCYAVKRAVFDKVGEADETYGLGPCWEMDYNVRAARAGFDGLWACAAYVWRAPMTARRTGEESSRMEMSRRRYQDKFCGALLRGDRRSYRTHCRGDACPNFAPRDASSRIDPPRAIVGDPLVTCIMPTHNRRSFIPRAIRCFLEQDYPNRELIVADDGSDAIGDLIPSDQRIRYFRVPSRLTVGAKRNYCCERASGTVIAHWDDDDWYPASRIRTQLAALLQRNADVCGSSTIYFHDVRRDETSLYRFGGAGGAWVAGTTMMYRREFWQRNRFTDQNVGEDTQFLWRMPAAKIADLADPNLCVASVHDSNVSPKQTTGVYWTRVPIDRVRNLMGSQSPTPRETRTGSLPLVSCLMPTHNRRSFLPLALACFRAQTYPNRELVVVDDGSDAIADFLRDEPAVRYIRIAARVSLGTKRNVACREARGEIMVLWDDDDWYAPERIERQVSPIVRGEAEITALHNCFVLELPDRRFWTVTAELHRIMFAGNVTGGTAAFRRQLWEAGIRYPEVNITEDAAFLNDALRRGRRLTRVDNDSLFVYVRHGSNTWRFNPGTFLDPRGWRRSEPPPAFPMELVDAYAAAAQSLHSAAV